MKHMILIPALAMALVMAAPASAACYADYKAKRDNPLKLHYGVVELPDRACGSVGDASPIIARKLDKEGWTLLNVLGLFGPEGLESRKDSAGKFFLRF